MFEPIFIELRSGKVDRKGKWQQTAPPAKSGPGERNRTADTGIFSSYVYIKIIDFKYFIYLV